MKRSAAADSVEAIAAAKRVVAASPDETIRTEIGRLLDLHPALGRHLSATVRMGTICVYAPASRVEWT